MMRVLVLKTADATAALLARLLAVGEVRRIGVWLPEQLTSPEPNFEALLRIGSLTRLDLAPPPAMPVGAHACTEGDRT